MPQNPKSGIFISYARSDAEPFAEKLCHTLGDAGFNVWWDKASMQSRGRTFLHEIQDAIENCDVLIAVITPAGVKSDYVRIEWEHAFLYDKPVLPVLFKGDFSLLPDQIVTPETPTPENLSKKHCPDFRFPGKFDHNFSELIRLLRAAPATMGNFKTPIPSLPKNFLPRQELLSGLVQKVMGDSFEPITITSVKQTTALQGMAGIGKSVLASALCRTSMTRWNFKEGIFFLAFGEDCSDSKVEENIRRTIAGLGQKVGKDENPADVLTRTMDGMQCLLVLDDIWNVKHVEPFRNALSKKSRIVITTRDKSLAAKTGVLHQVEVLNLNESLDLLARWSNQKRDNLPAEAGQIAKKCGYLPLALAMAGATVQDNPDRWKDVLIAFDNADYEQIQQDFPDYPYPDVFAAIQVGLHALQRDFSEKYPGILDRYLEFAVYPEEARIPGKVIESQLKDRGCSIFAIDAMVSRSLLAKDSSGLYYLHDTQRAFLKKRAHQLGKYEQYQKQFTDCYKKQGKGNFHTVEKDGYIHENLIYHLNEAGDKKEISALLTDFDWLYAKLEATDVNALIADYDFCTDSAPHGLIQSALRLSTHVLSIDKKQLASQLFGRLLNFKDEPIVVLLKGAGRFDKKPWIRPKAACLTEPGGALVRILSGHALHIHRVNITPDGRIAVSASEEKILSVWEIKSGKELHTLEGHTGGVNGVSVTADGTIAVSASDDKTLKVWDIKRGKELHTLKGHTDRVNGVSVTADGTIAVSASDDKTLKVWDVKSGKKLRNLKGHEDPVNVICVSADGTIAVSASLGWGNLKVWDINSGKELCEMEGHSGEVNGVSITADGTIAVSASGDKTLKVWDIKAGVELYTLEGHSEGVTGVCISADGTIAISASDDETLKVWDIKAYKALFTVKGHTRGIREVGVTADGTTAVSTSGDNTLSVWDIKNGKKQDTQIGHTDWVKGVSIPAHEALAVSASADSTLKVWDLRSGKELRTLKGHKRSVDGVSVTADGTVAISASWDRTMKVWDIRSGKELRTLKAHTDFFEGVSVTADGAIAVSASSDISLKVWDIKTGKEVHLLKGHTDRVKGVSIAADGTIAVSASDDHTLKVWDIKSGKELRTLEGHTSGVSCVSVTANGANAISASDDSTLKVWDIKNGKEKFALEGHTDFVHGVAAILDGGLAISASFDHSLKVWDLENGKEVATLYSDAPLSCCAISPIGLTIVAGDVSGRVHFLELVALPPTTQNKQTEN